MESFPFFFKIRAVTFTVIMLFSFLWLVLLSVQIFARWTVSDRISHSLMILFILTNTTTLILLPILILVEFRVWLDAARLLLLSVLQVGSATATTYWSPRVQCPDQTPDDTGVCQLIGVYTVIACWIIPAISFYSTYFAVVVYLQSRVPVAVDSEMGSTGSLSSWSQALKGTVSAQDSSTDTSTQPRPLMSPTMIQTGQSSLPQSLLPQGQPRSTLPNAPRRESTIPSLLHASQQYLSTSRSAPSRHHSLPAFKHGSGPHILPPLSLGPLATDTPPSHPQTPSSHPYSIPSSANSQNQFNALAPSVVDVRSPRNRRWFSKHLSMTPPSSSPREMQSVEGSPTTPRSARAKLSKPLPAHFM